MAKEGRLITSTGWRACKLYTKTRECDEFCFHLKPHNLSIVLKCLCFIPFMEPIISILTKLYSFSQLLKHTFFPVGICIHTKHCNSNNLHSQSPETVKLHNASPYCGHFTYFLSSSCPSYCQCLYTCPPTPLPQDSLRKQKVLDLTLPTRNLQNSLQQQGDIFLEPEDSPYLSI